MKDSTNNKTTTTVRGRVKDTQMGEEGKSDSAPHFCVGNSVREKSERSNNFNNNNKTTTTCEGRVKVSVHLTSAVGNSGELKTGGRHTNGEEGMVRVKAHRDIVQDTQMGRCDRRQCPQAAAIKSNDKIRVSFIRFKNPRDQKET